MIVFQGKYEFLYIVVFLKFLKGQYELFVLVFE